MDTKQVMTELATIPPLADIDVLAEGLAKVTRLAEAAKEAKRILEGVIEARIRETGQPVEIGDIRYYIGTRRKTRCRDKAATLTAILELSAGDLEGGCRDFFASEPFKHGAIGKALGDEARYAALFEVTEDEELLEGKPVKRLQSVNTRFLR